MAFRNRVIDFRLVAASELKPSPFNWRTHSGRQQKVLKGLLKEIGQADAVLVRQLEDGSLELIDGHLRAKTMKRQKVPCLVLDVTEEEAKKLLLSLDPLAEMADADTDALRALLQQVESADADVAAFLQELAVERGVAEQLIEQEAPAEFPVVDETIPVEHTCPKCGYSWSGGQ